MTDSDTEGEVKIRFKSKKPVRPAPTVSPVKVVKKRKISVAVISDEEPSSKPVAKPAVKLAVEQTTEPATEPVIEPVAEPEVPELEAPEVQDLDLEDVFSELEQGAKNDTLFDDFANPLDKAEEEPRAPEPQKASPFISSVRVDKRPLSGVRPVEVPNNLIVEKEVPIQEQLPLPRGDLGGLKKPTPQKSQVTTVIAAAPKKKTSTIGLFLAVLATVIAGGFVGALIYFWFFQE